jgi:hypothetical protein
MKKSESILLAAAVAMTIGSCGNKGNQQVVENDADTTVVVSINRDSTLYGICGGGTTGNSLELITDIGDTLNVSIAEANNNGRCFGGIEVGDRLAVMLKNKSVARQVINQTALLGDWVMPNPIDGSSEMGIRIKEGGIAESIDQPSLTYRSWRLFNGKLELVAVREGGGDEVETMLYDIIAMGPDTLVFKDSEDTFEYSRYKEHHYSVDIQLEEASEDDFKM